MMYRLNPPVAALEPRDGLLDFRPLPLLGNPHLQTLLGHLIRGWQKISSGREQFLTLPDGDCLVLYDSIPDGWQAGGPVSVVVHGLTGSHASAPVVRLAALLYGQGQRVVRVDLRGAGKSLARSRRFYHGGCSDDVRAALEEVHRWSPDSAITLVGLSLGGNVVLKLAGEAAVDPVPGLARVAALAPPIDLGRCSALLDLRRNWIYAKFFLRELLADARFRLKQCPDLPPVSFPRRMTIRLFDELYTVPRNRFRDVKDYYRRSSALPLIGKIRVPALIMTARDDPFIAPEPFESLKPPSHIELRVLNRGGHLGFLGRDGAGGIRWAERRIADWVLGN